MSKNLNNLIKKMIRESLDMGTFINPDVDPNDPQNQMSGISDIIDKIKKDQEADIEDLESRETAKKKTLFTPQSINPELERSRKEYTGKEIKGIQMQKKNKIKTLQDLESAKDNVTSLSKNTSNSSVSKETPPSDSTLGQLSSLFGN